MFGLDGWIAGLGSGSALILATIVACLLGLRHATDPDHLTAVTTLVAADPDRRIRESAKMGLAWGAGHATTLALFGLPIVVAARYLPERAQQLAETAVGLVIVALATRLLWRWHRGVLVHSHPHEHGSVPVHAHVHAHDRQRSRVHRHGHQRPRSPFTAYTIGLVHGMGGSAGVGVLLLASIRDTTEATFALLVFALFTAVSMAACSAAFGLLLARSAVQANFACLAPVLGASSLAFGAWYIAGALAIAPYPF